MAKKKNNPKKSAGEKTIIGKIAGQAGYLAGGLVAGKDHVLEIAGDAIESVKSTIDNFTGKGKNVTKKAAKAKKVVIRQAIAVTKKSKKTSPVKKAAVPKKVIKKAIKKVEKKVAAKK